MLYKCSLQAFFLNIVREGVYFLVGSIMQTINVVKIVKPDNLKKINIFANLGDRYLGTGRADQARIPS